MNELMDPDLLKRYLNGQATEQEIQQCELILQQSRDFELENPDSNSDSLVDTIRNLRSEDTVESVERLIDRIQGMTPGKSVGQEELDRVLGPPESSDELGRIGKYRVIEFIACGGMGLVFKVEEPNLKRLACLKILHPIMASSIEAKQRFSREARSAARLRSDRIVTVFDVGEHRELPFLVMPLLDGRSLRQHLDQHGPLGDEDARKLTRQIAEGLAYAHGLGLLHRDIKPENIWITTQGDVKLLDFGLARVINETTNLTNTGTIIGTPSYMSPEQVQGQELDERSDLFSLGSVAFEMLTGQSPFGKSNLFSTMMSIANDPIEFGALQAACEDTNLKNAIVSLLEKSPDHRVRSARSVIDLLDENSNPRTTVKGSAFFGGVFSKAIAAGLGAAILATGLWIHNATDKGTLCVEADPSMKVTIDREVITVIDPQTGKEYKVQIGEKSLPSGVYQLELIDPSGFRLSSDLITIRRGEKEMVRISLKKGRLSDKSGEMATNSNRSGPRQATRNSDDPPVFPPYNLEQSEPLPLDLPLKPTTIRQKNSSAPTTLGHLKSLRSEVVRQKLAIRNGAFGGTNFVQKRKSESNTAWTVCPTRRIGWLEDLNVNFDGTRIADAAIRTTTCDNTVRIWTEKGELECLLPIGSRLLHLAWSPDPNVLATLVKDDPNQLIVWRLSGNQRAEILDIVEMPGAVGFSWAPDASKLAIKTQSEILFYDLQSNRSYSPNVQMFGDLGEDSWSKSGRYFVTHEKGKSRGDDFVRVWDLKKGRLHHVFSGVKEARFIEDRDSVGVQVGNNWEIWGLQQLEREAYFTLRNRTGSSFKLAPSRSMEILAGADKGNNVVTLLAPGVGLPLFHQPLSIKFDNLLKITWSGNGKRLFVANSYQISYMDLVGSKQTSLSNPKHIPPILAASSIPWASPAISTNEKHLVGVQNQRLSILDLEQMTTRSLKLSHIDLSQKISPNNQWIALSASGTNRSGMGGMGGSGMSGGSVMGGMGGDDEYGSGRGVYRGKSPKDRIKVDENTISMLNLANGQLHQTINFDSPILDFHWSSDSQFLAVVLGKQRRKTPGGEQGYGGSPEFDGGFGPGGGGFGGISAGGGMSAGPGGVIRRGATIDALTIFSLKTNQTTQVRLPESHDVLDVAQVATGLDPQSELAVLLKAKPVKLRPLPKPSAEKKRAAPRQAVPQPNDEIALIHFESGRISLRFELAGGSSLKRFQIGNWFLNREWSGLFVPGSRRDDLGTMQIWNLKSKQNFRLELDDPFGGWVANPRGSEVAFLTSRIEKSTGIEIEDVHVVQYDEQSGLEPFSVPFPTEFTTDRRNPVNTYSHQLIQWHPEQAVLCRVLMEHLMFFNLETKQQVVVPTKIFAGDTVLPTNLGWVAINSRWLRFMDVDGDIQKTAFATEPLMTQKKIGQIDQLITSSGGFQRKGNSVGLSTVSLQANQLKTEMITSGTSNLQK